MDKPRILIVDDDADLLESLSLRLSHEGFDVSVAADGYEGLERARREAPDLLILDIHMPAGDGFSIQERLHAVSWPWPPVIAPRPGRISVIRKMASETTSRVTIIRLIRLTIKRTI